VVVGAAATATAEEYGGSTGDLTASRSRVFAVSGDGFAPGSVVMVSLRDEATGAETDLGALQTDANGAVVGSVTLPDGLTPGRYTLSTTGVTADGTTRVLSAQVDLSDESADCGCSGASPLLWVLVALAALAVVGAGWCIFGRRRDHLAGDADAAVPGGDAV
jgi:hypothetical protein